MHDGDGELVCRFEKAARFNWRGSLVMAPISEPFWRWEGWVYVEDDRPVYVRDGELVEERTGGGIATLTRAQEGSYSSRWAESTWTLDFSDSVRGLQRTMAFAWFGIAFGIQLGYDTPDSGD